MRKTNFQSLVLSEEAEHKYTNLNTVGWNWLCLSLSELSPLHQLSSSRLEWIFKRWNQWGEREREHFNLRPPPGSKRSSRSATDARQRFAYHRPNKQHEFSRKPRKLNGGRINKSRPQRESMLFIHTEHRAESSVLQTKLMRGTMTLFIIDHTHMDLSLRARVPNPLVRTRKMCRLIQTRADAVPRARYGKCIRGINLIHKWAGFNLNPRPLSYGWLLK